MDLNQLPFFEITDKLCNQIFTVYSSIFAVFNSSLRDVVINVIDEPIVTSIVNKIGSNFFLDSSFNDLIFGAGVAIVIVCIFIIWVKKLLSLL